MEGPCSYAIVKKTASIAQSRPAHYVRQALSRDQEVCVTLLSVPVWSGLQSVVSATSCGA
jgi:hypothetical protein